MGITEYISSVSFKVPCKNYSNVCPCAVAIFNIKNIIIVNMIFDHCTTVVSIVNNATPYI